MLYKCIYHHAANRMRPRNADTKPMSYRKPSPSLHVTGLRPAATPLLLPIAPLSYPTKFPSFIFRSMCNIEISQSLFSPPFDAIRHVHQMWRQHLCPINAGIPNPHSHLARVKCGGAIANGLSRFILALHLHPLSGGVGQHLVGL